MVANKSGEAIECFLHMVESFEWEQTKRERGGGGSGQRHLLLWQDEREIWRFWCVAPRRMRWRRSGHHHPCQRRCNFRAV